MGNYTLEEMIGNDRTGTVYLANLDRLDIEVVVKFNHFHPAHDDGIVVRFLREARPAARTTMPAGTTGARRAS